MFILKLLFFVLFFIVGLALLLMLPGKIYRHFFPLSEDQKATIEARKRLGEHLAAKKAAEKIQARDDAVLARINAPAETYTFNGSLNVAMVCPHCSNKGKVRTKIVERKNGISGAKATGALLTGGVSMLATGLSAKNRVTQAFCDVCQIKWFI